MSHRKRGTFCLFLLCVLLIGRLEAATVEFFASPNGKCRSVIVQEIDQAKSEILVACYDLSCPVIAESLAKAHARGVGVFIITDRRQPGRQTSRIGDLAQKKLPIKVDRVEALFHCKTMLIDRRVILTGSYNFSQGAQSRNAEHLWRITDTETTVDLFEDWRKHWKHSAYLSHPTPKPPDPETNTKKPVPQATPRQSPSHQRPAFLRRCQGCLR
jgi:phosphatidylserine/phosphatidylglycerophosphate/cardiolipin synthase-like enzyme